MDGGQGEQEGGGMGGVDDIMTGNKPFGGNNISACCNDSKQSILESTEAMLVEDEGQARHGQQYHQGRSVLTPLKAKPMVTYYNG